MVWRNAYNVKKARCKLIYTHAEYVYLKHLKMTYTIGQKKMPPVSTLCSRIMEYFVAIFILPHFFQNPYNAYIFLQLSEKIF